MDGDPSVLCKVVLSWGKRVVPLSPAVTSHWMQVTMERQGLRQGAPL